jgi:hypothetical protein
MPAALICTNETLHVTEDAKDVVEELWRNQSPYGTLTVKDGPLGHSGPVHVNPEHVVLVIPTEES